MQSTTIGGLSVKQETITVTVLPSEKHSQTHMKPGVERDLRLTGQLVH